MIHFILNLFTKKTIGPRQLVRSIMCDEYAQKYNLDRDQVLLYAQLNRTAEGKICCTTEDFEYAVQTIQRMNQGAIQ